MYEIALVSGNHYLIIHSGNAIIVSDIILKCIWYVVWGNFSLPSLYKCIGDDIVSIAIM